jgi:2,5-diketo-D-gluconate reductase B
MRTIAAAGVEIPVLGFGTWKITGETAPGLVESAIKSGYRHIDTASAYGNEVEVGAGIRASGVPREQIFLTTKIWNDAHKDGDLQRAAEASLEKLGVDQVDLLLIHWNVPAVPLVETIRALNDTLKRGMTRAIGVANFNVKLIEEAVAASDAPLATNQVEYHPRLSQKPVLDALNRHGMTLTAYSPLAHGKLLDDPTLAEIAAARGSTVSQVTLAWLLSQPEVVVIPKTASVERARENLAAADLALTADELARISALARPDGRVIKPDFGPEWDT